MDQSLESIKIIRVTIIFFDHVDRDCLALSIGQKPLQHVSRVNTADGLKKLDAVIGTCGLQRF